MMDFFFTRLFRREGVPGVPSSTSVQPKEAAGGQAADWTARILRPEGRRSLLVPAWYRGVSLIMQTMGQMKWQYQRRNEAGGNFEPETWGNGRRRNYLLQVRPNALMTASQMQEQIEFRKIYRGNALVYIERDEYGWPVGLWLCNEGGYDPLSDCYSLTYNRPGGAAMLTGVPSGDVLHFKNVMLTEDGYSGEPVIGYAMKTLSIAATANELTLKDVAKGGKHKILVQENEPLGGQRGLLSHGRADKAEMQKITRQLAADWDAGDAVFLNNIADAKIISQTAADLQLLETRGFEVNDLARILGIPRIMMMEETSGAGYKMPEHATQEFLLRTIQPKIREEEDELNSKLLGMGDFGKRRIHICELALRRLDAKGQAEIDKIHIETGVKSPNELRNQYDLPSIAGGDAHYLSTNLAEVGSEKLRGGAAGAAALDGQEKGGE